MCVRTEYVLAWCSMLLSFDLSDYFQKKNILTFDHAPGVEGVRKDRICVCMVVYAPFPLI